MTQPNANNLILTSGVATFDLDRIRLLNSINERWNNLQDQNEEGDDDKHFFVLHFEGLKFFVVYTDYSEANEENPEEYPLREVYTVMFPDEY